MIQQIILYSLAEFAVDHGKYDKTMYGGGKNKTFNAKYIFNGQKYKFAVHQVHSSDRISYSIYNNDNTNNPLYCMLIFYDKNFKYCYIENINGFDKYCVGMPYTQRGTLMFKFTLDFIETYMKKKYDFSYVELKDNSKKWCKSIKNNIDLSSFYMLLHGDTWYGKYGFVPFNTITRVGTDELRSIDYKNNQKIVKTTLVKNTKVGEYIKNAIGILQLNIPSDDIDRKIDKYKNKSIMEFMKMFMENYDQTCNIFYHMYEPLMIELKMIKLYGISYWKKL